MDHLLRFFHTCTDWLFPPREKEEYIEHLTSKDIPTLPKAHDIDDSTFALFSYKDPRVRALVWELKYHKNTHSLNLITPLFADMIIAEYADKFLFHNWQSCLLVPVPSSPSSLKDKGFSQTKLMCEHIKKLLPDDIVYSPDALVKKVDTQKQNKLTSRGERLKNLHNTHTANPDIIAGKYIILIDDVTTTGATLIESRRALYEAGAKDIFAFTIAH
jgi:competence protein ComFC